MNTKKLLLGLAFAVSILMASCSPNSVADEDSLYQDKGGVDKSKIRIPGQSN
ncbi:hypothetical protein GWK08_09980 [Leptobacterium flavescens]|uniref:Quinol oxidase subunit 4 n=1 Tax=Leptobacterium flavescens TaxID=472055 RepID=A0A6P0UP91_9FLAO|nr:hypothetical protein [Leptobacterium flavescens]NER13768.1 hypothetical protein [Leptobacterium flavescens]